MTGTAMGDAALRLLSVPPPTTDPVTAWLGVVGIALGCYLLSCAWRPYARRCPWPWCTKGKQIDKSRYGNYRRRRPCRVCGGKDWRRMGARLIGRG